MNEAVEARPGRPSGPAAEPERREDQPARSLTLEQVTPHRAHAGQPLLRVGQGGLVGLGLPQLVDLGREGALRDACLGVGPAAGDLLHVQRDALVGVRQVTGRSGMRDRLRGALATFKAFSIKTDPSGSLSVGIEVDPRAGRADTGSLELDLSELAFDLAESATELGTGVVVLVDEMQELDADELAAICTAVHQTGQRAAPFYVVGPVCPTCPACWPRPARTPSDSSRTAGSAPRS